MANLKQELNINSESNQAPTSAPVALVVSRLELEALRRALSYAVSNFMELDEAFDGYQPVIGPVVYVTLLDGVTALKNQIEVPVVVARNWSAVSVSGQAPPQEGCEVDAEVRVSPLTHYAAAGPAVSPEDACAFYEAARIAVVESAPDTPEPGYIIPPEHGEPVG